MPRDKSRWLVPVLSLLALVLIVGGIWVNLHLAETAPGGDEFITYWNGLRAWFTQGTSPYNLAVQLDTEMLAYGHPAQAGEPRLIFISPIYSALIMFPFALISDYSIARSFWMTMLELALIATVILSARLVDWKPSRSSWVLLILFAWVGFYSIYSILSGSPAAIVGLLIVLALTALRYERQELAGILFALATCFPVPVILLIAFVLLWAMTNRKGLMATWLVAGVLIFSVIGVFFIRDWPLQLIRSYITLSGEQALITSGSILKTWLPGVGGQLSWVSMIFAGSVLLLEWILARRQDFRWFCWVTGLTLVLQTWIGIPTRLSYMVILLFPLVLVLANWEQRLGKSGNWLSSGSLVLLVLGGWIMAWNNQDRWETIKLLPTDTWGMISLFIVILVIGLYWVRWWTVRPLHTYLDKLRSSGL